jgi:hypothetical protein
MIVCKALSCLLQKMLKNITFGEIKKWYVLKLWWVVVGGGGGGSLGEQCATL